MNPTLTPEDRRHVRTTRIAMLTAVFTIALGSFAWAGVNMPAAERAPEVSAGPASAATAGPAPEVPNETLGCGCAEGCRG
jgi:hypothetical protein